jgi:hypothetical protein
LFCGVLCIPTILYPTIKENSYVSNNESKRYFYVDKSDLSIKSNGFVFELMFFSQAIVAKILPCILLVVYISLLINSLVLKKKNQNKLGLNYTLRKKSNEDNNLLIPTKKLSKENLENGIEMNKIVKLNHQQMSKTQNNLNNTIKNLANAKNKENSRTTLMLTTVCILFLIAELPQSIFILLSIIKGTNFYENVYMPLGDLFDITALVNNSINFILYCTMSSAFRITFWNIILCKKQK